MTDRTGIMQASDDPATAAFLRQHPRDSANVVVTGSQWARIGLYAFLLLLLSAFDYKVFIIFVNFRTQRTRRSAEAAEDYKLLAIRIMPDFIRGAWKLSNNPSLTPLHFRYVNN